MKRYTINDMKSLAISRNGRCLSDKYSGSVTKLLWACSDGHKWEASPYSVRRGTWCPHCAHVGAIEKSRKYILQDAILRAKKHGGECLSKEYINVKQQMEWRCSIGHVWNATFAGVLKGDWCLACKVDKNRNTINMARDLAKIMNGKCLSTLYKNNHTKLAWECYFGHRWCSSYNSIQSGTWCPMCKNKTQEKLTNIIENIFVKNIVKRNYKPDWLRNPNTNEKLEIDIFLPELKLGIEYDGEQHYIPVRFGGMNKNDAKDRLKYVMSLDKIKDKEIHKNKDKIKHFVRFNYKDKLTKENVIKMLKKNNIRLAEV